ncbi:hypothetical protein J4Q44_G00057900 [Coregonus suidteri]|uniref:Uncharacterized protein n=1 Tax=Coregonus suidteri TaxID=861788 RepID=A0AAN8R3G3_9TELE
MQLGAARLSRMERQRRLRQGHCLYGGQAGHHCNSCPEKLETGGLANIGRGTETPTPETPRTFLPFRVQWARAARRAHVLVDSGAPRETDGRGDGPRVELSVTLPLRSGHGPGQPAVWGRASSPAALSPCMSRVAGGLREDIQFLECSPRPLAPLAGRPQTPDRLVHGAAHPGGRLRPCPVSGLTPTTHQPKPPSQTTYQSSPLPQVPHSEPPTAQAAVCHREDGGLQTPSPAQTWQSFPREYWDLGGGRKGRERRPWHTGSEDNQEHLVVRVRGVSSGV